MVLDQRGCLPTGRKRETQDGARARNTVPSDLLPLAQASLPSFCFFPVTPSKYESINGLIHSWNQMPPDPVRGNQAFITWAFRRLFRPKSKLTQGEMPRELLSSINSLDIGHAAWTFFPGWVLLMPACSVLHLKVFVFMFAFTQKCLLNTYLILRVMLSTALIKLNP